MRKKWSWFPYDASDYKAAQGWLDAQAQRGWVLKHIYFGSLARLEEAEHPRHAVDLCLGGELGEAGDQNYLQLCDDAGWELVQDLRGMFLFRAKEGADPAPIQTDDGIVWERFWKKYMLKNTLISAAVIAVCLFFIVLFNGMKSAHSSQSLVTALASNGALFMGAVLALAVAFMLWDAGHTIVYYFCCRRAGTVVEPGRKSTAVRAFLGSLIQPLMFLGWVLILLDGFGAFGVTVDLRTDEFHDENTATVEVCRAWPVVMGENLGLDSGKASARYLDGRRSVLMDYLDYSELIPHGEGGLAILTCERYDCVNETLSRWLLGQRKRETARGAFLWGELPWEKADLPGYDESYVCRENSYLLLREGNIVALVGCSQGADLTSAAVQDMLWERLELE